MYKFYSAQITQFGAPAVVVVDAFKNAGGYFKAESFCVFPSPHAEKVFNEIRFEAKSFENSPVELNEDFMLKEALAQSRIDIALHIEKHYSGKTFLIPQGELQLLEVELPNMADFLEDISDKTSCEELRTAIKPHLQFPSNIETSALTQ